MTAAPRPAVHTPGPWLRVDLNPDFGNLEQLVNSAGRAAMQISGSGGAEWHANAALITSAPDLLAERDRLRKINTTLVEALRDALECAEPLCQSGDPLGLTIRRIARAALATTQGEE